MGGRLVTAAQKAKSPASSAVFFRLLPHAAQARLGVCFRTSGESGRD